MRYFATLLVGLGLVGHVSAQTFIIDNFNQTSFNLTANSGTPSIPQYDSGLLTSNTIGGSRITRAHFVTGGGPGDALNVNNTASPGQLQVSCTTTASGHFHLYYGYSNYDTSTENPVAGTHTFTDMNTDVQGPLGTTNIGVAMGFQTLDHNATLVFKIVTHRGEGTETVSLVSKFLAANLTPFTYSLTNAEILGGVISGPGVDFTDVDQVILQSADLEGGTDFLTDNFRFFQPVPEPATVALIGVIGAGIAGGAYMKRRRQKKFLQSVVS